MSEGVSRTRFVTKDAPTVEVVVDGLKELRTYRWTREVFPTPGSSLVYCFFSVSCCVRGARCSLLCRFSAVKEG